MMLLIVFIYTRSIKAKQSSIQHACTLSSTSTISIEKDISGINYLPIEAHIDCWQKVYIYCVSASLLYTAAHVVGHTYSFSPLIEAAEFNRFLPFFSRQSNKSMRVRCAYCSWPIAVSNCLPLKNIYHLISFIDIIQVLPSPSLMPRELSDLRQHLVLVRTLS